MVFGFGELVTLLKDGGAAVAAVGTLIWIVWHYNCKTIPRHNQQLQELMDRHAAERAALADQCAKERADMWESFREDMARERDIRLREIAALTGGKADATGRNRPEGPGN